MSMQRSVRFYQLARARSICGTGLEGARRLPLLHLVNEYYKGVIGYHMQLRACSYNNQYKIALGSRLPRRLIGSLPDGLSIQMQYCMQKKSFEQVRVLWRIPN